MSPLFVSTSFLPGYQTPLAAALDALAPLDIDGVELASTHRAGDPFADMVVAAHLSAVLVHNYFPPSEVPLVLNIASEDQETAQKSVAHMCDCIDFSADIGAALYTFHPGFTADTSAPDTGGPTYDFTFSGDSVPHDSAFTRMLRAIERISGHAARRKISVAVESQGSRRHPGRLLLQRPEEFSRLDKAFGASVGINLNLAHTALASRQFGFDIEDMINATAHRIRAVEISHCDRFDDQHLPLVAGSFVFDSLPLLPQNVPFILEFRNATISDINTSLRLLRLSMKT